MIIHEYASLPLDKVAEQKKHLQNRAVLGYVHFADYSVSLFFGEMAEWSNALVLKTSEVRASVGSNPTLPAR